MAATLTYNNRSEIIAAVLISLFFAIVIGVTAALGSTTDDVITMATTFSLLTAFSTALGIALAILFLCGDTVRNYKKLRGFMEEYPQRNLEDHIDFASIKTRQHFEDELQRLPVE